MSEKEKENEKREWPDPKDFGLPYVDLVPLNNSAVSDFIEAPTPVVLTEEPAVIELKEEIPTKSPEIQKDSPKRYRKRRGK